MNYSKLCQIFVLALSIFTVSLASCSTQQGQSTNYDPSKKYVAVLIVNSPQSKNTLDGIKQKSVNEGYEIGPIEYFDPGTKDFEPLIRKLTTSKQITILWIAGSLLDTPNIQKGISKVEYQGSVRYMPVTGSASVP